MGNTRQLADGSATLHKDGTQKQLVEAVREKGSRSAFEKIFRLYYKRLHSFAYSYVERMDYADDVVQTVFLRIWVQKESWNPPGSLKKYLFAAIRNEALNVLRHKKVVRETEEEVSRMFRRLKKPVSSYKESETRELRKAIEVGISQLPSQCQKIFILSRKSGLTYSEIADFMNISVNTVGTQMGRALKSLRKHLSEYLCLLPLLLPFFY